MTYLVTILCLQILLLAEVMALPSGCQSRWHGGWQGSGCHLGWLEGGGGERKTILMCDAAHINELGQILVDSWHHYPHTYLQTFPHSSLTLYPTPQKHTINASLTLPEKECPAKEIPHSSDSVRTS
ncbi:hypothetical protein BDZ94DRAFT_1232077 [Collybia nuda]|uniref:Uncharacterized protein n=1 Tax=Collybia nuda TaxID=64659 RepID=A0A9P6CQB4_9AGAR|nr:hypothetical protein BDZ94DRAFT_1232077 [Collybia nuda]